MTKTVEALIQVQADRLESAGVFFGHGTATAFDEAAWLTLWKLGLPLDALDEHAQDPVSDDRVQAVVALIDERIGSRRPAAYLTGEAWLQGVPFHVDERCIVPRSFIAELLVDPDYGVALDAWLTDRTRRVLDLCTGNGSLAVLAAMAFPDVAVDAADLSADALAVAGLNVTRHGLQERIRLFQGDGLAAVPGQVYDLILCNPPYVNAQSMSVLPDEYRAEPDLALAGGPDGMDFIRVLLASVAGHLSAEGVLVLEIGNERANFEAAFPELATQAVWMDTSSGDDQVLLLPRDAWAMC